MVHILPLHSSVALTTWQPNECLMFSPLVLDHLVQYLDSCSVTCSLWRLLVCHPLSGSPPTPPPTLPPSSPRILWSCSVLPCRQKTLTWPSRPAFLWLCLIPLSAGGYPLLHLLPFPCCGVSLHVPPGEPPSITARETTSASSFHSAPCTRSCWSEDFDCYGIFAEWAFVLICPGWKLNCFKLCL